MPGDAQAWWFVPAVAAALVALLGTMLTLVYNGMQARRERRREMLAGAFSVVADYWEFPYVVRRRRADQPDAERVRISESLREVQRQLSFYQAWIETETPDVGAAYNALVSETRRVMGSQIHDAWKRPPAQTDGDMNIADIRRDGLDEKRRAYLRAVRDHLSVVPTPARRLVRRLGSRLKRSSQSVSRPEQRDLSDTGTA